MAKYETLDWYETPLLYDIVFEEDTTKEGLFLEQAFERFGRVKRARTPRRVLEPACGSGRLLLEMARRGWRPTGFDLSQPMLDFAGERLRCARLEADLRVARMEAFRFKEKFELAHCLVSTFKYLLDEKSARGHLRAVAEALLPGGIYVLGYHLTWYPWRRCQHERWIGERDGTRVVCNIRSWPPEPGERRERVRSRLVVTTGDQVRRHESSWWFRTYNAKQSKALLAAVPEFEHVATYDFCYDWTRPRDLDDKQLDTMLILRRR
ncbi:MAG: class I SAM-dependent methyltransferase [Planctomycetes bacterium]|nr:class I SAM-dependent methyltransferase [Planctomycetota bacterium]